LINLLAVRNTLKVSLISFCLTLALALPIAAQGTYRCQCADGTYSNSCGHQGACSGHGGIAKTPTPGPVYPTSTRTPVPFYPTSTPTPTSLPATATRTPTPTPAPASRTPTPTSVPNCPDERATVKLGTDIDAGLIDLTSSAATTIEAMRSWPAPSIVPPRNRISPYETTVWVLDATLVEYKLEDDSDYHLVLIDAHGNTIIAEIASPACASRSRFAAGIANARAQFNARFSATGDFQLANVPVRISGVGMFDFLHGQTGAAPNGIELHPAIDLSFDTQAPVERPPVQRLPPRHQPHNASGHQ